jgi:hypothetical protein
MQAYSVFLVPGGLAIVVAIIGFVSIIRDRRRAAAKNKLKHSPKPVAI